MPEQSTERKIHIRVEESLHHRLRIRCAELDTTIQDFVLKLLARELSRDEPSQIDDRHIPAGQ